MINCKIIANNIEYDRDLIIEDCPVEDISSEEAIEIFSDRLLELNQQGYQALILTPMQADELFVHLLSNR